MKVEMMQKQSQLREFVRVGIWNKRGGRVSVGILLGALLSIGLGGCTFVSLTPEGEAVQVANGESFVTDCRLVGRIRTHTKSQVGIVTRSTQAVTRELERLAKNDASDLGANTILAEGNPSAEGKLQFRAYDCP